MAKQVYDIYEIHIPHKTCLGTINREGRTEVAPEILEALRLDEGDGLDEVLDAVMSLKRAAAPEGFVLRDDMDAVIKRVEDAEAALEAHRQANYELERAALRNGGASASARNDQEKTMTQFQLTQEIKMRAGKLRRESGGVISMHEAIQRVTPGVMEEHATPAPPEVTQPTVQARQQDEAYRIMDRARAYQREQFALGTKVSNAEAVRHVSGQAA